MRNFTIEIDSDGIATVTFDVPGRSMNTITAEVQAELSALATRLKEDADIRAAVIVSGKRTGFCAGADLMDMEDDIAAWRVAVSQDELKAGVESAGRYSLALRELETCGKPIAAAISGVALGGGLELALACTVRVAVDDPKLRLGLPEATIGLMPGAGATQRLPRLMGAANALPYLLEGTPFALADAVAHRIVHEVVAPDDLVVAAKRRLAEVSDPSALWDRKGFTPPGGSPHSVAGYSTLPAAVARIAGASGLDQPAKANILRAVYEGVQVPIDAGLRIESRYFFNTVRSMQAARMVATLFTARQQAAKAGHRLENAAYVERLRTAWNEAATGLARQGHSPTILRQIARAMGAWPPEIVPDAPAPPQHHLPDFRTIQMARQTLLDAAARATDTAIEEKLVEDGTVANLIAIQAGFPAWTGGPWQVSGVDTHA